jgi:hypothetical protein
MTSPAPGEQLQQLIEDAFADVPHPGEDVITPPPEYHWAEDLNEAFRGHHWRDIPGKALEQYVCALPFMKPEERHYYLPAYLLRALDKLRDQGVNPWRTYALDPPDDMTRFKREYDAYPEPQRNAVRLFLAHVREACEDRESRYLAQESLARYWGEEDALPPEGATRAAEEATRKEQVKQAIREAFADVPHPGDQAICNPKDWEGMDINWDFRGYGWRELPRAVATFHNSSLSLMLPGGLHFYLPTYLLMALDGVGDTVPERVMYSLGGVKDMAKMHERFDGYSLVQRSAIRLFLEHMQDSVLGVHLGEMARQGLEQYW